MVDTPGALPSPNEPFVNPDGNKITRTWYRVLASLTKVSGQLAQPIVVGANSFFVSGSFNSGSTLVAATIPADTLLGNSSTADAAATTIPIDSSLSMADGSLGVAALTAASLLGNSGTVAAQPGAIAIGSGLTLLPTTPPQLAVQSVAGGSPGNTDLTGAQVLSWWRQ